MAPHPHPHTPFSFHLLWYKLDEQDGVAGEHPHAPVTFPIVIFTEGTQIARFQLRVELSITVVVHGFTF